ncbi:MAG: preprotein translocase subunit SecG [Firmicutes bacterium]|nr:preprotein translocase subunit SecG [Bacillota bacterium]
MFDLNTLLNVAPWISSSFPIIRNIIVVLIALLCFVMIIAILVSPPNTGQGGNAITGAAESYYTKRKGKNNQGRIRNLIIICAATIAILSILYFITYAIFPNTGGGIIPPID